MQGYKRYFIASKKRSAKSGFTLIELSIVLVIIGLVAGGVLVGQELIAAAKIRQVSSEIQQFQTAINTFRIKYNCKPGDCANATTFFSGMTCSHSPCNGNGNKTIGWRSSGGFGPEWMYIWLHLGEAGLIDGRYTGIWATGTEPGVDLPESSYRKQVGWYLQTYPAPASIYAHFKAGAHYIRMGTYPGSGSYYLGWNSTRAMEAKRIDQKLDDGMPLTGKIMVRDYHSPCVNAAHTDYNILGESLGGDESKTNCNPHFTLDW